jgi:predicted lipoprotein
VIDKTRKLNRDKISIWKDAVMAYLKYPAIPLEEMKKITIEPVGITVSSTEIRTDKT